MMIALEESKIESEECRHLLKIGLLEVFFFIINFSIIYLVSDN